jgi:hypothetical protein
MNGETQTVNGIYRTNFLIEDYTVTVKNTSTSACTTTSTLVLASDAPSEIIEQQTTSQNSYLVPLALMVVALALIGGVFLYSRKRRVDDSYERASLLK